MKLINNTVFKVTIVVVSFCFPILATAQYSQTIKGSVRDQASQTTLPGVNIILLSTNPVLGAVTDSNGEFKIKNVPVGRYDIQMSFIGYETTVISSVLVTSGKEVIINAAMKEMVALFDEVTVRSRSKNKALNTMTTLSARTFTVEETSRYAGGLDDPGRLVSVFAGVSDGNLQSNGIVVRGNAPFGTGYRIEGLSVDNPNHFAGEDFLGGGFVSILSKQILTNSDFLTGAFPAEYGNALSSVFDMNLKTGNTESYEHTFQAGIMGIDFASEGPLAKNKNASYLFNYRYSTFGIIKNILPDQTGLPVYQDLGFKLNFKTKAGTFSLWGAGGLESYKSGNEDKKDKEIIIDDKSGIGIVGLKHKILLGNTAYLTTSVGVNVSTKSNVLKKMWTDSNYYWDEKMEDVSGRYMFTTNFNKKISSRWSLRTGIEMDNLFCNIDNKKSNSIPDPMGQIVNHKGTGNLWQLYFQVKYNLLKNLSINAGLHEQYFSLNNSNSTEPRVGIQWSVNEKNMLSFAYGRHSQVQQMNVYFVEQTTPSGINLPNKNLGFMKADHFILGYDLLINKNIHLKIEPYYQSLFNVPVEANTAFSIINLIDLNTFNKALVNKGTGRNIGLDFTLERFFNHGFYYLFTASVFDSKFKGGDGIERNTIYNKRFIANLLGGKEFKINNNMLSLNGRLYINRGNWISPLDYLDQTNQSAFFVSQQPTNYRFDISASYTKNKENYNTIWSIQVLNVLNSKCPMEPTENLSTNEFYYKYGKIVLPSISWKIEF